MKPRAERENEPREEAIPSRRSLVAAITAVAAVYAYFLIFAQFGLLRAMTAALGEGHGFVRPALAAMGMAGMAGSVLMARIFNGRLARHPMSAGFVISGVAAGLAALARTPAWFLAAAVLTGLGTGIVTVGLAGLLRGETGPRRLGRCIGAGTGLAYALCNVPGIFAAAATTQAVLGLGAALAGLIATRSFTRPATAMVEPGTDYTTGRIARWVSGLFALVTADSAMFHLIQHTPVLKAAAWATGPQLWINAGAHLAAGLFAGWLLDRHRPAGALLLAAALLAAGGALVFTGHGATGAPLYAAGVSVYSAALVFYPARSGRVGLAALVYAVAGWAGSALGIGLAENVPF